MAALYTLKIIASDHVHFDGRAFSLVVPALDGERAILAHHEEMIIALKEGPLKYKTEDQVWHEIVVGIGIAEIANNRVNVLVDSAERPEDIDEKRAEEALWRAQERMRQQQSIQEYHVTQASMARALSRLKERQKYDIK